MTMKFRLFGRHPPFPQRLRHNPVSAHYFGTFRFRISEIQFMFVDRTTY